jgi:hypothetical protein
MEKSNDNQDIDDIVAELKQVAAPKEFKKDIVIPVINDDTVGDYIYQKSAEMLELTMNAIKDMQQLIQTAADPKEISAYAQLMGTAFKGIENLNKINIQQKQAKNNIEVKKIESDAKLKSNPLLASPTAGNQTNNIFIGSRDEAMQLLKNKPPKKIELIENTEFLEE